MKRIILVAALAIIAGASGANAQSAATAQGPSNQTAPQTPPAGTGASPVQKRQNARDQLDTDLVYQKCYMKCINSGNPADFCEAKAGGFCS